MQVPFLVCEITGMGCSGEGHSIKMTSVAIGLLTFRSRNCIRTTALARRSQIRPSRTHRTL